MPIILSSVPVVRVRFVRTVNNLALATKGLKATPTVRRLTVPGQHGFIDLDDVTSQVDPDTGVAFFDLVATDDPDVNETFGWTITGDGWTGFSRVVAVPQTGSIVETITVQGASRPAVWLNQLADFTGSSGSTGPDAATRTYVDDSLDNHEDAPDPHPQYALDTDVAGRLLPVTASDGQTIVRSGGAWVAGAASGGSATPDATTSAKGKAVLLGGTADAPTVPWSAVTGKPTIPAAYTDEQAQDAVGAALTGQTGKVSATYDDGNNRYLLDVQNLTKADVGLNNVSNTADANKPVSSATQTALDAKGDRLTQRTSTATTSTTATANEVVPLDTTGGVLTLTGPGNGVPFGARWKAGTAAPTIAAPNGYTINGAASISMGLAPGGSSGELVVWQAFGTDYQPVGGFKPQSALDARLAAPVAAITTPGAATDSRAILATADAQAAGVNGEVVLRPGTYRIASNLIVQSPVLLQSGAVIKPDSGVTVTLAGGVDAARRQVFDHSGGGIVAPLKVDFYHPSWWGPVNTADDTASWTAMLAAIDAVKVNDSATAQNFGQRILAPAGVNRFFGLTLTNCELVAHKGVSLFYPSGNPTGGSMITISHFASISGGFWRTNGSGQAIALINYQGFRAKLADVYVAPIAAGSTGIYVGSGNSITPVMQNIQVHPGTLARVSTGIVMNTADAEMSDVWVAQCDVGIRWLIGASRAINLHVWGCNTGMLSSACDEVEFTNVFLDSNLGWGADFDLSDRCVFSNLHVWNNGATISGTGGMRMTRSSGSSRDNVFNGGIFDDNTGVGLLLDGPIGTEVDGVRFASRQQQAGQAAVCNVGCRVTAASPSTRLNIRGRRTDHITVLLEDLSANASVDLETVKRVLGADVSLTSTGFASLIAVPVEAGERWLLDGALYADGGQTGDLKVRLQATGVTGVVGQFGLAGLPAAGTTSATNTGFNTINTAAVATSAGSGITVGMAGGGIIQGFPMFGHVVTATVAGTLDLQAGQQTADATATTIRAGSWLRLTRVG